MSEESPGYGSSSIPQAGEQVRLWRRDKGMRQGDLETKASLSHNTVSRIETGAVQPRLETLEKLAGAMGISVEELQFRKPRARVKESRPDSVDLDKLMRRLAAMPESRRRKWVQSFLALLDAAEDEG